VKLGDISNPLSLPDLWLKENGTSIHDRSRCVVCDWTAVPQIGFFVLFLLFWNCIYFASIIQCIYVYMLIHTLAMDKHVLVSVYIKKYIHLTNTLSFFCVQKQHSFESVLKYMLGVFGINGLVRPSVFSRT